MEKVEETEVERLDFINKSSAGRGQWMDPVGKRITVSQPCLVDDLIVE
jgi:hypothetical protein